MKKLNFLSLVLTMIVTSACQGIILKIAGVRKPQIETKKSVFVFLKKANQDTLDVYGLDSTLLQSFMNQSFKPGWHSGFRPVQIRVYNKTGEPIMHWASCEGYLRSLKTFDTVPPRNQINLDSTLNLWQDLNRYYTLDGHPARIESSPEYDYYFIVTFSRSTYRMSKKSFRQVHNYIRKHPEIKFKVYKINVDVLDWWDVELITDIKIHY